MIAAHGAKDVIVHIAKLVEDELHRASFELYVTAEAFVCDLEVLVKCQDQFRGISWQVTLLDFPLS